MNQFKKNILRILSRIFLFSAAVFSFIFCSGGARQSSDDGRKDTVAKDTTKFKLDTTYNYAQPEYGVLVPPPYNKDTLYLKPQQKDSSQKKNRPGKK